MPLLERGASDARDAPRGVARASANSCGAITSVVASGFVNAAPHFSQ